MVLWRHLDYFLSLSKAPKKLKEEQEAVMDTSVSSSIAVDILSKSELEELKRDANMALAVAMNQQSDGLLALLAKLENEKKPNILRVLCRQIKDLLL